MHIRHANVIFYDERAEAVARIHGYLDELGIAYCGRYGEWGYLWTDESFASGERAAERILSARRPDLGCRQRRSLRQMNASAYPVGEALSTPRSRRSDQNVSASNQVRPT